MERQEFEDSLKRAFEGAEVSPTDNVWVGIELDLEKERSRRLKKRVLYYQLLAAAAVMFAIGISVNTYLVKDADLMGNVQIAENTSSAEAQPALRESGENVLENQPERASSKMKTADNSQRATRHSSAGTTTLFIESEETDRNEKDYAAVFSPLNHRDLPKLVENLNPGLPENKKEKDQVDPVALMMAKLEQREKEMREDDDEKKDDETDDENLWTSVGFAAGSFTAVNAGVSSNPANASIAMNSPQVNEEVKASGMSYSMGINLGTKISERWVLQGGVNYLTQSSEYTAYNAVRTTSPVSNFTSFKPPSVGEVQHLHDAETVSKNEKLVATAPYNVNNNIRYLTIPVQAGYMVVNRNFGVQVNAGVASDLFLQNTVSAEGDGIDESTQMPGGDAPYRQFNFSGLVGTEFSYKFGDRYRISLNPGIRYPFNSIYKSDLDVKASPLTLDIGLRFRYIFH